MDSHACSSCMESISDDVTLDSAIQVYELGLSVNPGATLTLLEGVLVKLSENYSSNLTIFGTLNIQGTESNPVVITSLKDDTYGGDTNNDGASTSPAPGDWGEIWLYGTSNLNFAHAIIRYGGGNLSWEHGTIMAYLTSSPSDGVSVSISNSVIEHNTDDGVYLRDEDPTTLSNLSITNSTIRNNGRNGVGAQGVGSVLLAYNVLSENGLVYPVSAAAIYAQTAIVSGNTFSNNPSGLSLGADSITLTDNLFIDQSYEHALINSYNNLIFYGNSTSGQPRLFKLYGVISGDVTLDSAIQVYELGLSVNPGATLTLLEGVLVKLSENYSSNLTIFGTLNIQGTESNPVVITSLKDDTYGGDTNNDGASTSPAPGDWGEIWLYGTSNLNFAHAIIRYGGGNLGWEHGAIMAYLTGFSSDGVSVSIVTVSLSIILMMGFIFAMRIATTLSNLSITNSTIRNNGRNGVGAQGVGNVLLAYNVLSENGLVYPVSAAAIYAQTAIVSGNTFSNNPSGLSLGADSITLTDNLFIDQSYEHAYD